MPNAASRRRSCARCGMRRPQLASDSHLPNMSLPHTRRLHHRSSSDFTARTCHAILLCVSRDRKFKSLSRSQRCAARSATTRWRSLSGRIPDSLSGYLRFDFQSRSRDVLARSASRATPTPRRCTEFCTATLGSRWPSSAVPRRPATRARLSRRGPLARQAPPTRRARSQPVRDSSRRRGRECLG